MITFLKNKNIFDINSEAIINTVNCVGVMGKGIALQFKQKYKDNFKEYKSACNKKNMTPGKMFVYQNSFVENPKYIINFPTKNHWKENSKIEYIDSGLKDLVKVIKEYDIKSITIPPLGCGNGGLEWNKVKELINKHLNSIDIDISVTEPNNNFHEIKTKEKVKLTPFRAVFLKLIQAYNDMLYELGNIEIQKLVYFQNIIMGNTKLKYEKNKFGPYCPNLYNSLNDLSGHYLDGVTDGNKKNHIKLKPNAEIYADKYINENDPSLNDTVDKLKKIIEGFETPFGMELLATVHWVASEENAKSISEVISKVHSWNERKRSIMTEDEITIAYNHLKENNLIQ